MIIYIICFVLSAFLFSLGEKRKKWNWFSIIGIIIPTLLAAFRNLSVGVDTNHYYVIYKFASHVTGFSAFSRGYNVEPLYFYVSKLSTYFGGFPMVLAIYEFLGLLFMYNVAYRFRKSLSVWLVMFLYLCFLYNYSLNIMRQAIALPYLLWCCTYLIDGKRIKFFILSFIGTIIHTSIIIAIPIVYVLYLIANTKTPKKVLFIPVILLGIAVAYFSFLNIGPLLNAIGLGRLSTYAQAYVQIKQSQINIIDVTYRITFILMLWIGSLYRILPSRISFSYLIIIVTELGLMMFGLYNDALLRVALYLSTFHFLFLSYYASSRKFSTQSKFLLRCIIIIMGLSYWYWVNIFRGSNGTFPYELMTY